nr:anaerobic ribonucleoside-triphosphate reductase [Thermodesulfovibrio islandicus]
MFTHIIKRDGRIVPFDPEKITTAIAKAGKATGEFDYDVARRLTVKVLAITEELIRDRVPHVEEIQDIVEEVLMQSPYRKTAKAYIIYRDQHAKMREIARQNGIDLVDSYLEKVDWRVNENANVHYSLQGLNNYISGEISKTYWLHKIYPPEVRNAYLSGDIHIHDLGLLSAYCCGWDLKDLLLTGFRGLKGRVESNPPKHFRVALMQAVNFMYSLQNETAGACAFSNVDTLLAPFIAYDGLNYKQVKQIIQEFLYGFQWDLLNQ